MDASLRLISGVPETLILTLCAGFLDGVFGEHDSEPFKEKRDRAVRGSISLPPARTGPPRRRPRSQHTPTRFGPSRRSTNTCALNEQTGGLKGRLSVTERGGGGSPQHPLAFLFFSRFLSFSSPASGLGGEEGSSLSPAEITRCICQRTTRNRASSRGACGHRTQVFPASDGERLLLWGHCPQLPYPEPGTALKKLTV